MTRISISHVVVSLMAIGAGFSVSAQSINITGTVVDSGTSQNIAGALVKLTEYPQITTTTAANGTFTLAGSATAVRADRSLNLSAAVSIQGDRLTVAAANQGDVVKVEVFNSLGSRVYHADTRMSAAGSVSFDRLWQAAGLYYVKVRIGTTEQTLLCSGDRFQARADSHVGTISTLAKISAGYTLEVSKTGYVTKQMAVSGLTAAVGTVKLHSSSTGTQIFFDDFTGSSVDATKWSVCNRIGDLVNGEIDCCLPDNVTVSNGILSGVSKHEDHTCGDSQTSPVLEHYTTWNMQQKTASFLYGTIEVRAKIPGGTGLWPCIWMLGNLWQASQPATANIPGMNWPHDGWCEIDIAEFWQNERNAVSNGCHWQTGDGIHNAALPFDATTRFMVYRLQWSAGSLIWSVDAEDGAGFRTLRTLTGAGSVPNVPMYVVVSCAVGGSGGGTPNPATFPLTFSVDWVRVTQ